MLRTALRTVGLDITARVYRMNNVESYRADGASFVLRPIENDGEVVPYAGQPTQPVIFLAYRATESFSSEAMYR